MTQPRCSLVHIPNHMLPPPSNCPLPLEAAESGGNADVKFLRLNVLNHPIDIPVCIESNNSCFRVIILKDTKYLVCKGLPDFEDVAKI